jgi:predicted transcriptional regulator
METISIEVEPEIARAYQEANLMERKKMQIILNSSLKQFVRKRSLEEIIQEMQAQAQANGLNQEILDEILSDDI